MYANNSYQVHELKQCGAETECVAESNVTYSCIFFDGRHVFNGKISHARNDIKKSLTNYSMIKPKQINVNDPRKYIIHPIQPSEFECTKKSCPCQKHKIHSDNDDKANEPRMMHDHSKIIYHVTDYEITRKADMVSNQSMNSNLKAGIAIPKMLLFHENDNKTDLFVQVVDIIINTKYHKIVISDGHQIFHCRISPKCKIFSLTLKKHIPSLEKYDIIQILQWNVVKQLTSEDGLEIIAVQLIQNYDSIIASNPTPYFYPYSGNNNVLGIVFSKDVLAHIQPLSCGCSCLCQRDVKYVNKNCKNFFWDVFFEQYQTSNLIQKSFRAFSDKTFIKNIFKSKNERERDKIIKLTDTRWIYCKKCVVQFIIVPKYLKMLITAMKLRCNVNNNLNLDNYFEAILVKIFHYPLLVRFMVNNYWKLIINYWISSLIAFFPYKDKILNNTNRDIVLATVFKSSALANIHFVILKLFEMRYFKTKHIKFIFSCYGNVLEELLFILRAGYLSHLKHFDDTKIQRIELDRVYRIIMYLVKFKPTTKYIEQQQKQVILKLYDAQTDGINDCASMLKFGKKYINQIVEKTKRSLHKEEKQFLKQSVKNWKSIGSQCQNMKCHKSGDSLKICKGCKLVFYCSKRCQKIDWNRYRFGHRIKCKIFAKTKLRKQTHKFHLA
eukprot:318742_1